MDKQLFKKSTLFNEINLELLIRVLAEEHNNIPLNRKEHATIVISVEEDYGGVCEVTLSLKY